MNYREQGIAIMSAAAVVAIFSLVLHLWLPLLMSGFSAWTGYRIIQRARS